MASLAAEVYYCGCNDACCGYAGAVLYTRSPSFGDLLPEHQAEVRQAVLEAKVDGFEFEAGGKMGMGVSLTRKPAKCVLLI